MKNMSQKTTIVKINSYVLLSFKIIYPKWNFKKIDSTQQKNGL